MKGAARAIYQAGAAVSDGEVAMEHEEEFAKLVRHGSYYDELLRMGHVVARVADTKAWRDEIKAKARGDKIKVRTGLSHHDDHVVWAFSSTSMTRFDAASTTLGFSTTSAPCRRRLSALASAATR
jgi:hypothetical protein